MRYRVKNPNSFAIEVSVTGSISNLVGFNGTDVFDNLNSFEGAINVYKESRQFRGINLSSSLLQLHQLKNGSMALITVDENVTAKPD